jgi:hypothetical protein
LQQRIMTREELHRLVWTRRMGEVADELNVSVNELEALIATLDVPFPFSGYWAQKSAGQAKPPRLRPAKPDTPGSVVMTTPTAYPQPRTPIEQGASEIIEGTAKPAEAGVVPAPPRLIRPHRFIAARLEVARRDAARWRGLGVGVGNQREDQIARRRRIIEDLLFKELERRGHEVTPENASLHQIRFVIEGQTLSYAIRERYRQRRQTLPPEELSEPYNVAQGRTHTHVRLMTGQLILAVDGRFVWPKREWRDSVDRLLEQQVPEIVDGLERLAADASAKADQRAAEDARYREEQARREELHRRQLRDTNQWRRFRELAVRADEAVKVRDFIARLREQAESLDPTTEIGEWLAWTEQRLAEWDPFTSGAEVVMQDVRSTTERDYSD